MALTPLVAQTILLGLNSKPSPAMAYQHIDMISIVRGLTGEYTHSFDKTIRHFARTIDKAYGADSMVEKRYILIAALLWKVYVDPETDLPGLPDFATSLVSVVRNLEKVSHLKLLRRRFVVFSPIRSRDNKDIAQYFSLLSRRN